MGKIIHFLLGSVRIRVTGAFPERFLNLCGMEGVRFWDVKQEDAHTLTLTLPGNRLKRGRELAGRAMCEAETLEGRGLPFFLGRFRDRYALIAGLLFAIFGAVWLSRYILVVEVTGNQILSDSVILTELERQGFGVGSYGPAVDERALSNAVLLELPELSFLSVNISGVYAEVVVRESEEPPELEDRSEAADIVAVTDGVILNLAPVVGRCAVEEGQAVLSGEVLISGLETHERGDGSGVVLSSSHVRAEGEVWAMTSRTLRSCIPLECIRKQPTGKPRTVCALNILKKFIKFYSDSSIPALSCDKIKCNRAVTLPGGTVLPLALETMTLVSYEPVRAELKRESAEAILTDGLSRRLSVLMGQDGTILSSGIDFAEENGVLTGTLHASCIEQIGKRVEMQSDDS